MRVLVTGGCGFIGSHLVDRLLAADHQVTVLDNLTTGKRANLAREAQLIVGDVTDSALVQELAGKADAIVHLAAVASVEGCTNDWLNSHKANLTGTITIFDAAARAGKIPVVYASSAAVYGDNPAMPLREDAVATPLSSYGLDKLSAERYGEIAWKFHGVPNTGVRFFNVYGPRQDARSPYSGVISKFVAKAREGAPITFFGDGEQSRDFVYVGDIATLLMRALAHAKGADVFNGCTGRSVSLRQLAEAIGKTSGQSLVTRSEPARAGDIRYSCGDPSAAREALQFSAKTTLEQGLAALLAHDIIIRHPAFADELHSGDADDGATPANSALGGVLR